MSPITVVSMTCAFAACAAPLYAQNAPARPDLQKQATLSAEEAGVDFKLQGEYRGELADGDGGQQPYGVQVIARGDGRFHAVAYPGGLPGDGWTGDERIEADGERDGDSVTFKGEHGTGVLTADGKLVISDPDGAALGTLDKVARRSPTLGRTPLKGAVVLFGGKNQNDFQGSTVSEEELLVQGATSTETFQSGTLHLEFLLSYMPHASGQARANSGCYLQGRYEVQILDSFGLSGEHNECGGIYETRKPDVNMCLPPLAWQTYDIDFTAAKFDESGKKTANARMTVRHNGVVIHKDAEVPEATRAAPQREGPQPGSIYLQDHGNPIRFRNVWFLRWE